MAINKQVKPLECDILVIGGGIAGLSAALECSKKAKTILVAKDPTQNSTSLAQGGIAVAIGLNDSTKEHYQDTLYAGAGLCNKAMVRKLVTNGVHDIHSLLNTGIVFDKENGTFSLTKEGAHSKRRILHVGDSTGAAIEKELKHQLTTIPKEQLGVIYGALCVELLVKNNVCHGGFFYNHSAQNLFAITAKKTILATGGYVQVYSNNSNPPGITGDGIALAYEAGAKIQDMEFVQFHPTTLQEKSSADEQLFLISEAVRGEGALLLNTMRSRFMPDYHPLAELAPRDVVSRAILEEMHKTSSDHVLLDFSLISHDLRARFPAIYRKCKEHKINITKDLVPVAPAAHYSIGGIRTNQHGESSIQHLYACGECAATGIHGANRLASNSLLEGLVFGKIAAKHATKKLGGAKVLPPLVPPEIGPPRPDVRTKIQAIMWQNVGILRHQKNLEIALKKLQELGEQPLDHETRSMLTCAILTTKGALYRKESRGCHYRIDYPRSRRRWHKHIIQTVTPR